LYLPALVELNEPLLHGQGALNRVYGITLYLSVSGMMYRHAKAAIIASPMNRMTTPPWAATSGTMASPRW
jgi:hypothetical protein